VLVQSRSLGNPGTRFHAHQRIELEGKCAFRLARKLSHQHFGDDEAKNPVAQELELFVIGLAGARMRQRALQQTGIAKCVAERDVQIITGVVIRQV
jgi:hypothetical protein